MSVGGRRRLSQHLRHRPPNRTDRDRPAFRPATPYPTRRTAWQFASSFWAPTGVTFVQETVTTIDPVARRVTTNAGAHEADFLVVALGADYDFAATPGMTAGRNEFYTSAGAEQMREAVATVASGHVVVGIASAPYKCPPAPSETVLLLHDELARRRW